MGAQAGRRGGTAWRSSGSRCLRSSDGARAVERRGTAAGGATVGELGFALAEVAREGGFERAKGSPELEAVWGGGGVARLCAGEERWRSSERDRE